MISVVLETERLRLRPMKLADWPNYLSLMQSDRSVGMGGPLSMQQAWGFFCHDLGQWALFGHGALMFDCRETGKCLGQVAINSGPLFPENELGWFVYPEAEGKGHAFEAAKVLLDWAFDRGGIDGLVSYVSRDNRRSRRLAERLGAVPDPDALRPDPDDVVYRYRQFD